MKKRKIILIFILLALVSACRFGSPSSSVETGNDNKNNSVPGETPPVVNNAAHLNGKVAHISDGDTFIVESADGKKTTVRIHAIDAPELSQTFGAESRENLRALIANQEVEIRKYDTDQYHRMVGSVFFNDKDIGLEQIKGGYAWHFKQYQKQQQPEERTAYTAAEEAARSAHLGLWRDGSATNPQNYRRSHKNPYTKQSPTPFRSF
jgi:endonuclease YncB( thermonuclease family)